MSLRTLSLAAMKRTRPNARSRSRAAALALALATAGAGTGLLPLTIPTARAAVAESPLEFIGQADLDGDGNPDGVIVDRLTGAFRVGYQTAPGQPSWAESRASGIDNVTSLALGRVLSLTRDGIVVTAPAANRINLLDVPNAASPANPVSVSIPSIGPSLVGAIDILGGVNTAHDDLYVVSTENPGARESLVRNTGASQSGLADTPLAAARYGADTFTLKLGSPVRLGLIQRGLPNDRFLALRFPSPAAVADLSVDVPFPSAERSRFVGARFADANPLGQVLFYQPGQPNLVKYQVQEPAPNTFTLGLPASFPLPDRIQSVQLIPASPTPRLLVLSGLTATNATVATVYQFDGVNAPVALYSATNSAGYNGAIGLGSGNLTLLARGADGRSARFENWNAAGVMTGSGDLPGVNASSGQANVLLFTADPFLAPSTRSLKSMRAGEWSSNPVLAGGPPPAVSVRAERYLSPSNGLGSPVNVSLGTAPVGTTYAMVNQYTNPISIFSAKSALGETPAEVSIQPPAGAYPQSIKFSLKANTSGWNLHYRLAPNAPWQAYSAPVTLYSNATVQFYGREAITSRQTPIGSAAYTFPATASTIDSDGDGIPDYVEVANGLNPNGGPDSDGDGRTDLEELVRGSSPTNPASTPAGAPLDTQQAFDLITVPRAIDTVGTLRSAESNVLITAYSPDGRFHTNAFTTDLPGLTSAAARLISIEPIPSDRLIAHTTDLHYKLRVPGTNTTIGRELIGLFPTPNLAAVTLPPGNLANSPASWIAAAGTILSNAPRKVVTNELSQLDSAAAALFEAKVAQVLLARGTNWATNITLFPWRFADLGRTKVTSEDLLGLEAYLGPALPAYGLRSSVAFLRQQVAANPNSDVVQFRALLQEIHQISAAHNDDVPGALSLPFSVLRQFIDTGVVNSNHVPYLSGSVDLARAFNGVQILLGSVPPRPTTNVTIEVVASAPGTPTLFRLADTAVAVTLWTREGAPCPLPDVFDLVPGSRIAVFGHTDINPAGSAPGSLPIEVISTVLTSIPVATGPDADGNLLLDQWEDALLGGGPNLNPFADDDGDGATNIEEMLAGTDPNNPGNKPAGAPQPFVQPAVTLGTSGNQISLIFNWPADYIGKFNFGVKSAGDLNGGFTDIKSQLVPLGGNSYQVVFDPQPGDIQFFTLTISLKQ